MPVTIKVARSGPLSLSVFKKVKYCPGCRSMLISPKVLLRRSDIVIKAVGSSPTSAALSSSTLLPSFMRPMIRSLKGGWLLEFLMVKLASPAGISAGIAMVLSVTSMV